MWQVEVTNPALLLRNVAQLLAGNARISVEGDLSDCDFSFCKRVSHDETPVLKRNTISPIQDFIVLPLEPETVDQIILVINASRELPESLFHVLIEKDGELQFGAYDNFDPACVTCGKLVPDSFIKEQVRLKTILEP